MYASERRAGLTTCERCQPEPLPIGLRVQTPAGPGQVVEWDAAEDLGEVELDTGVMYPVDGDDIGRTVTVTTPS